IQSINAVSRKLTKPITPPAEAWPDRAGSHFPRNRSFRFAIPSLRLKSGVRFELVNKFEKNHPGWEVAFYFGTSKAIHSLTLDKPMHDLLMHGLPTPVAAEVNLELSSLADYIGECDVAHMQA